MQRQIRGGCLDAGVHHLPIAHTHEVVVSLADLLVVTFPARVFSLLQHLRDHAATIKTPPYVVSHTVAVGLGLRGLGFRV